MYTSEQTTTQGIAWAILLRSGLGDEGFVSDTNLRSSQPNIDNLASAVVEGEELVFDEDGMPLMGGYPNSYDYAPSVYGLELVEYPRTDSVSRQAASEKGWRVNKGAANHLDDNFSSMMPVLRAIVLAKRQTLEADPTDAGRDLTALESLDVLNASTSMWSYMRYKKKGRTPKDELPGEVSLLHRSMSGVRMSLLRLFLHDEHHSYRIVKGWQDEPFSAESWLGAVEASKLLVGTTSDPKQECVAPTAMIRRVLETVVEPPSVDGAQRVSDLEAEYRVDPKALIEYGWPWYNLEQATAEKNEFAVTAMKALRDLLDDGGTSAGYIRQIEETFAKPLRNQARDINTRIHESFLAALAILGYDPKDFAKS